MDTNLVLIINEETILSENVPYEILSIIKQNFQIIKNGSFHIEKFLNFNVCFCNLKKVVSKFKTQGKKLKLEYEKKQIIISDNIVYLDYSYINDGKKPLQSPYIFIVYVNLNMKLYNKLCDVTNFFYQDGALIYPYINFNYCTDINDKIRLIYYHAFILSTSLSKTITKFCYKFILNKSWLQRFFTFKSKQYLYQVIYRDIFLHITSNYSSSWPQTLQYYNQITSIIGKSFNFYVTGFIFTPQVVVARVLPQKCLSNRAIVEEKTRNVKSHNLAEIKEKLINMQRDLKNSISFNTHNLPIYPLDNGDSSIISIKDIPKHKFHYFHQIFAYSNKESNNYTYSPDLYKIINASTVAINNDCARFSHIFDNDTKSLQNFTLNLQLLHLTIGYSACAKPKDAKIDLQNILNWEHALFDNYMFCGARNYSRSGFNSTPRPEKCLKLSINFGKKFYKTPKGVLGVFDEDNQYSALYLDNWIRFSTVFAPRLMS